MARRRKQARPEAEPSLALPGPAGETLAAFPAAVVNPLRHMITLLSANGTLPSRLALIAALREEGVTYTGLALATIMAHDQPGTVCLIELNWEWPGLQRLLGAGAAQADTGPEQKDAAAPAAAALTGLAAVLESQAALDEALIRTGFPNLALLPAGEMPADRRPVAARSSRLRAIIEQLADRFDCLLLDVPAVTATIDAIPLARLASACLVVIRQGVTPRRVVASLLDDLGQSSVLGVVLNRAAVATPRGLLKIIPQE